jgi:hypothetical protein
MGRISISSSPCLRVWLARPHSTHRVMRQLQFSATQPSCADGRSVSLPPLCHPQHHTVFFNVSCTATMPLFTALSHVYSALGRPYASRVGPRCNVEHAAFLLTFLISLTTGSAPREERDSRGGSGAAPVCANPHRRPNAQGQVRGCGPQCLRCVGRRCRSGFRPPATARASTRC